MVQKSSNRQVAIPQQLETEIFVNEAMGITIKQFDMYGEESIVWFSASNASLLIEAINRAVDEIKGVQG